MTKPEFCNRDNWDFYDKMPPNALKNEFEHKSGLDGTPDLAILRPYWENANSILELGAGEGRAIDGLLESGFTGRIYGLERSPALCRKLRRKYLGNSQLVILEQDLLDSKPFIETDVAVWLWSGIMEFNPSEQQRAICKLGNSVRQYLCIDTPKVGTVTNASKQNGKQCQLRMPWGAIEGAYIPSKEEVESYICGSRFILDNIFDLQTALERIRTLYVLKSKR